MTVQRLKARGLKGNDLADAIHEEKRRAESHIGAKKRNGRGGQ
jgi:hypothetical protein